MVYGKWRNVTSTKSLNALRFHEEDLALAFRNAKEYERHRAKGDMTVTYVRPPVKMITQKMNSSDQLWHHVIGPAMISIGQRIDALKPVGAKRVHPLFLGLYRKSRLNRRNLFIYPH